MKRRIISPPAVPRLSGIPGARVAAEHVPAHDRGADVGQRFLDHPGALIHLPALEAVHRPEDGERKHPLMQPLSANPEWIVLALLWSRGVAVEGHCNPEAQLGHAFPP
jgi:hypothetical protein